MSEIISFDLVAKAPETLDVTGFFPMTSVHAIRSTKPLFDTIKKGEGSTPDFRISKKIILSRFRTVGTLDLARREFFEPDVVSLYLLDAKPRPRVLDLFPPLTTPYGALDIRGNPLPRTKKYSDLYRRSLPLSLHVRRVWKDTRKYTYRHRKILLFALIASCVTTLPILFYTKMLVESAYGRLLTLSSLHDPRQIGEVVHTARSEFERANVLFTPFRVIPTDTFRLGKIAIDGGLAITRGLDGFQGDIGSASGEVVESIPDENRFRPDARSISPLASFGIATPTVWLRDHEDLILALQKNIAQAGNIYLSARSLHHPRVPEVIRAGEMLVSLSTLIEGYTTNKDAIFALLGADQPERYIIFNQNHDEIRANGGFPGSIITFTLYRGNIEDFRTDDVYYYDWNLYPYKEPPPPGLALIAGNYGLRDVNYYPDFHETLEKANSFVERSGDQTLTVGIAVHQGIVENLLKKIGPVTLSGIHTPIMDQNFSALMSTLVESRYGERVSAKDILGDFVTSFIATVEKKKSYDEVYKVIMEAVDQGEILFASRNEKIDAFLSAYRKPLPWEQMDKRNWAYPILTSLSGNKSDRQIVRSYVAQSTPTGNCRIENVLTFTHTHGWKKSEEKKIGEYLDMIHVADTKERNRILTIQGKGKNITFLRLYVPKGSVLTGSTAGWQTQDLSYATEFSATLEAPLGGSTSKSIRYVTPIAQCTASDLQTISWYRQPGLNNTEMKNR